MKFTNEWMGLETIILNEETQTQKVKHHMFSLICGFESLDNFAFSKTNLGYKIKISKQILPFKALGKVRFFFSALKVKVIKNNMC